MCKIMQPLAGIQAIARFPLAFAALPLHTADGPADGGFSLPPPSPFFFQFPDPK
jgi:hypothetical protein